MVDMTLVFILTAATFGETVVWPKTKKLFDFDSQVKFDTTVTSEYEATLSRCYSQADQNQVLYRLNK